jgi:hypothetical protein
MAIIRRVLELAWVGVGLLVGWTFSWAPAAVADPTPPPTSGLPD